LFFLTGKVCWTTDLSISWSQGPSPQIPGRNPSPECHPRSNTISLVQVLHLQQNELVLDGNSSAEIRQLPKFVYLVRIDPGRDFHRALYR